MKLMEHKNPIIKLMIYGKLKRMLTSYIGLDLKNEDKNLIRGVFTKKLKDFDEDRKELNENKSLLSRLKGHMHIDSSTVS
jgi:hypothetical protein